jgi:tetratricopeptide (TPR) repeat protein
MFRLTRRRRFGVPGILAALAYGLATLAYASEPEWLKLETPTFGVISQLDEEETRAWARELDQFVGALHDFYGVQQAALPPLTIVLFRQPRDFAPYRLRTDSGQARVSGFFGNTGDWSIIGLPADSGDGAARQTLYHEAVHWFSTASDRPQPLWFAEGLAEVLSTFTVVDGNARWGEVIVDDVLYLSHSGLLPMQALLQASQDDALHGEERDKYYPQAWAFVHYLMFGQRGTDAGEWAAPLRELAPRKVDAAAFGKTYEELTSDLQQYLERGRYGYAEVALRDRGGQMTVAPASDADVAFALGRLATVGGNLDLAGAHAVDAIALAPHSPAGYELKAYVAHESGDDDSLVASLERAVELGSRESWIYATQADRVLLRSQRDRGRLDELLPAETARSAADLYERALALRPRNSAAFTGLVMALLNVDALTAADDATLSAGRVLFPTDGLLVVGQAAAAKGRGDALAAVELLAQATAEPFTMPRRYHNRVVTLRNSWLTALVNDVSAGERARREPERISKRRSGPGAESQ